MQFNVQPIHVIGLDYEEVWACINRPELTDTLNELQFLNNREAMAGMQFSHSSIQAQIVERYANDLKVRKIYIAMTSNSFKFIVIYENV